MDKHWRIDAFGRVSRPGLRDADPDFYVKDGYAFPKWLSCGNYRTPDESSYAFGCYLLMGPRTKFKEEGFYSDYDDRLRQFYPERWEDAWKLMKSNQYAHASFDDLSKFLSHLYQKKVKCIQVFRGCNVGNGYPYHIFVSRKVDSKDQPHDA